MKTDTPGKAFVATFSFELPDKAVEAVGETPESFLWALRLAASMFWYARGEISQEVAATVAGLDRTDFLLAISRHEQDIFPLAAEDLDRELSRIAAQHKRG